LLLLSLLMLMLLFFAMLRLVRAAYRKLCGSDLLVLTLIVSCYQRLRFADFDRL